MKKKAKPKPEPVQEHKDDLILSPFKRVQITITEHAYERLQIQAARCRPIKRVPEYCGQICEERAQVEP